MDVSTSAGAILKIIQSRKKVHSKELLEFTRYLKERAIQLYTYKIDYMGHPNSTDYWDDLSLLASSGLIGFKGENPTLFITERGLKTIDDLGLELPPQIDEALTEFRWRK